MATTSNSAALNQAAIDLAMMETKQEAFINSFRLSLATTSDACFVQNGAKDFVGFFNHVAFDASMVTRNLPSGVITKADLHWICKLVGDENPHCEHLTLVPEMHVVTFNDGKKFFMVHDEIALLDPNRTGFTAMRLNLGNSTSPPDNIGAQPTTTPTLDPITNESDSAPVTATEAVSSAVAQPHPCPEPSSSESQPAKTIDQNDSLSHEATVPDDRTAQEFTPPRCDFNRAATLDFDFDNSTMLASTSMNLAEFDPFAQPSPFIPGSNFINLSLQGIAPGTPTPVLGDTTLGVVDNSPASNVTSSADCNTSANHTGIIPGTPEPGYATPPSSLNPSPVSNTIASGNCNNIFNQTGTVPSTPKPALITPSSSFASSPDNHHAVPSTPTPAPKPVPTGSGKTSTKRPVPQYIDIAIEAYHNYRSPKCPKGMLQFAHMYEYAYANFEMEKRGAGFKSGIRHAVPKVFVKVEDGKKPDSGVWWTLDHDFKGDIAASNRRKPKVVKSDTPETPQQQGASESEPPKTPRKRRAPESESEAPETPCKKSKTNNNAPVATMAAPIAQSSGQQPAQTHYYGYPQNGQQNYQGPYYQPATTNYEGGQYHPAQPQASYSQPTHDVQEHIQPAPPVSDAQPVNPQNGQLVYQGRVYQPATTNYAGGRYHPAQPQASHSQPTHNTQQQSQPVNQPSVEENVHQHVTQFLRPTEQPPPQQSMQQSSPEQSMQQSVDPSLQQSMQQPVAQSSPQQPMQQPAAQPSSQQSMQQSALQISPAELERFQQWQWQQLNEFRNLEQQQARQGE